MDLRNKILQKVGLKSQKVRLKDGTELLLKELSAKAANKINQKAVKYTITEDGKPEIGETDITAITVSTVIQSTFDPDTLAPIFSDVDYDILAEDSSVGIVNEIYNLIQSTFKVETVEEAKNV